MADIIPLHPASSTRVCQGEAFCIQCGHEWQAVAEPPVKWLECPNCHTMKGLLRFHFYPPEGSYIRVCDCGNELFFLTPEGHLCANCGTYQSY